MENTSDSKGEEVKGDDADDEEAEVCVTDNKGTTSVVMTDPVVAVTGVDSINTGLKHTESTMISEKPEEPPATQVGVESEANASHNNDNVSMPSRCSDGEEDTIYNLSLIHI